MKKKIVAILSMTLAMAFCGAMATPVLSASANAKSNSIVTDDFGDKSYTDSYNDSKWEKIGDEDNTIKQATAGDVSATLVFKNDANADNIFAITAEKYSGIKSVTFDVLYSEGFQNASANWLGLSFVQTKEKSQSMYAPPLLLRAQQCPANKATLSTGAQVDYAKILGDASGTSYEGQWLTFKYEITSASTFDFYMAKKGGEFSQTPAFTATTNAGAIYNDAYLAFAISGLAGGATVSVDNVAIETEAETIVEDFESIEDLKFEIIRKDSSKAVRLLVYSPDALSFVESPKGARLVAKNVVENDDSILTSYEVISAEFNLAVNAGAVSFVYALPQTSNEVATSGVYEYVMTATEGKLLQYNAEGEATEIGKNVFTAVGGEEGAKIQISIDKKGTMTVYENGQIVKDAEESDVIYEIEAYAGYVAFQAAEDGTNALLDDVVVKASTYFVPETKSLTNNFSTDYIGGEDTRDFYMPSTPNGSLHIENDRLCFDGCSDGTLFGSCYQYDNFILDYKLTDIYIGTDEVEDMDKTGVGRWFGLDIGRPNYDTGYYGHYLMFYFNIVSNSASTTLNTYVTQNGPAPETMKIDNKAIPMSLFNDISYDGVTKSIDDIAESDAVCVRWVAENNTLKLYMKKAGEIEYTLYSTITGIETNGYMALCCTGFTHLHVDDFSLANTSTVYTCASNEAPETQIIEVEPEYDYNKYIETGTFKEELNYIEDLRNNMNNTNNGGCAASVGLTVIPVLTIGAVGYFVFRKKEDK